MDFMQAVKVSANTAVKVPRKVWNKHDSGILTAITIIATGAAVYFALKDGPKARKILDEKKEKGASNTETAKALLPVCGRTMMAVAVAWGSSILNHKRMTGKVTTLVEALSLARSLREDTRQATVDTVGEEKTQEIEKKVSEKRVAEKPVIMPEVENTGHGQFIFREPMTGKTFKASKDYVELVVGRYSDEISRMYRDIRDGRLDPDTSECTRCMDDIFQSIGLSHCGFAELFVWDPRYVDRIDVNLNNTFEYEAPDGSVEPGYILDFYTKPTLAISSYSDNNTRWY